MKLLIFSSLLALGMATSEVQAYEPSGRNPTVYDMQGNEIGLIQLTTQANGQEIAILSPAILATLDLGYHDIAIPTSALRQRVQGGWFALGEEEEVPPV